MGSNRNKACEAVRDREIIRGGQNGVKPQRTG